MPTINKVRHKKQPTNNIAISNKKFDNSGRNFYSRPIWFSLRNYILSNQPLCQDCLKEGRYVQATDVHHIIPFMSGLTPQEQYQLFTDPNNLVALCDSCHHKRHSKKYIQKHDREYR